MKLYSFPRESLHFLDSGLKNSLLKCVKNWCSRIIFSARIVFLFHLQTIQNYWHPHTYTLKTIVTFFSQNHIRWSLNCWKLKMISKSVAGMIFLFSKKLTDSKTIQIKLFSVVVKSFMKVTFQPKSLLYLLLVFIFLLMGIIVVLNDYFWNLKSTILY